MCRTANRAVIRSITAGLAQCIGEQSKNPACDELACMCVNRVIRVYVPGSSGILEKSCLNERVWKNHKWCRVRESECVPAKAVDTGLIKASSDHHVHQ
jgi:hypothetical protein